MHQAITIFASLAVLLAAGCGGSNPPPAPPAPAYQPPKAVSDDQTPNADLSNAADSEPSTAEDSNLGASSLTAREPTVEGESAGVSATDPDNPPAAAQTARDDSAEAADAAGDDHPIASADGNRSGKNKLLRGLARSFSRALPKAISGMQSRQSGDRDKPAPVDQRPPTPDLNDDPYPKGEPADEPADEKP